MTRPTVGRPRASRCCLPSAGFQFYATGAIRRPLQVNMRPRPGGGLPARARSHPRRLAGHNEPCLVLDANGQAALVWVRLNGSKVTCFPLGAGGLPMETGRDLVCARARRARALGAIRVLSGAALRPTGPLIFVPLCDSTSSKSPNSTRIGARMQPKKQAGGRRVSQASRQASKQQARKPN